MRSGADQQLEDPIICGEPIRGRKHMCAFVDSVDEQYDILLPFLREGFSQPDKILCIVDPTNDHQHRCRCAAAGIDLAPHEASGKAPVCRFEDTYLRDGRFSADRMVDLIRDTVVQARADGYPRVRGFGEMHWALSGLPGTEELVEYESKVNDVWDEYLDPLVCVYDVNRFSGRVLMDILCCHPKVILGGRIIENQYYMPPKEFLKSYRSRKADGTGGGAPFRLDVSRFAVGLTSLIVGHRSLAKFPMMSNDDSIRSHPVLYERMKVLMPNLEEQGYTEFAATLKHRLYFVAWTTQRELFEELLSVTAEFLTESECPPDSPLRKELESMRKFMQHVVRN